MAKSKSAASKRPAKSSGKSKPDSVVEQIDDSIPQVTDPKVRADLLSLRFALLVLQEDVERMTEKPSLNFQKFHAMSEELKYSLLTWGDEVNGFLSNHPDGRFDRSLQWRDQHQERILEDLAKIKNLAGSLPACCFQVTQSVQMLFEQEAFNIRGVTEEEDGRLVTETEWFRAIPRRIPNRLIERAVDSIDLIVKRITVEKVLVSLADISEVIQGRKGEPPKDWQPKIKHWGVPEVQDAAGRHRKWFLFKILPTLRQQFPHANKRIDDWIEELNLI